MVPASRLATPPQRASRPSRRQTWYEVAPEALLTIGLTAFLVDETDAATSAFHSSRAVVLMAAAATAWVLARVALAWLLPSALIRMGVFAVAALGVLGVVVLPAYDNDTVVETFPGADPTSGVRPFDAVAPRAADPPTPSPSTPPVPPSTSPPTSPPSSAATTSPPALPPAAPPAAAPLAAPTPAAAPGPVRLRTGHFRGIDHRAVGTVVVYRQPDDTYIVALEGIDIQPGPDYDLYLVPGGEREDLEDAVRLDDLRGNRGTQYYQVPSGLDLVDGPWTVLVWCQTFHVPIASATPS